MARAYAFVLQGRDTPAPDVVELTSPFAASNTPKKGLTLADRADGTFLMGLFTAANQNNQLLQIVTVSLPLMQDKEPSTRLESLKTVEYIKLSHLSAAARSELINLLVEYYENKNDVDTVMKLVNASSSTKFTSLCATNPKIIDAIAEVLPNIGAISHHVIGNGATQKVNDGITVFRGGDHPDVVFSVKAAIKTISGHNYSEFRLPSIACKPLLSQNLGLDNDEAKPAPMQPVN